MSARIDEGVPINRLTHSPFDGPALRITEKILKLPIPDLQVRLWLGRLLFITLLPVFYHSVLFFRPPFGHWGN